VSAASRLLKGLVAAIVGCALTACAVPDRDGLGLEAVAQERAERAQARVDALLASFEQYLTDRWPGIRLPETAIEAWVPPGAWTSAFETCASEASGLRIRVTPDAGVFADPPPQTVSQRRDVDVAIYLCQGTLPPPGLAASDPGPVEIAWVTQYARETLPACLRREGVTAQPLSSDPFAILSGGSTPSWDPYAALLGDGPALRRVQAMCPHPATLLAGLSPVGAELTEAPTAGDPTGGAP
jgi:hypothetical protein